jgi:hypothetical protein
LTTPPSPASRNLRGFAESSRGLATARSGPRT